MNEKAIITAATEGIKLVGSFGGLVYLVTLFNMWRNRVRVNVRVLSHHEISGDLRSILRFEAENIGSSPTSIEPRIKFSGFLPRPLARTSYRRRMPRFSFELFIDGTNRTLQPHVPVQFEARSQNRTYVLDRLGFMFFKTYTFSFTRGRKSNVRIYSAEGDRINFFQYWGGRFLVAVLGAYGFRKPKDMAGEVSDALSR
jgi:hypothetical protein